MEHELKTVNPHFSEQFYGRKTFEIREEIDRYFTSDDTLLLREWEPDTNSYTGRWVRVYVIHILRDYPALKPMHVVMSTERRARFSEKDGLETFAYSTVINSGSSTEILHINTANFS